MSLDTALKQRKRNRHTGSGRPGIVEQTTETGRRPVPLLSMRDIDELFAALGRSGFRSRFRLGEKEAEYLEAKGLEVIIDHARDFVAKRLADAQPANDGRQTPRKNHTVFIAQHATATCCRKCRGKRHHIPKARALTQGEIDYIVAVLRRWLVKNLF